MSIEDALLLAAKEIEHKQKRERYKEDIAFWAKDRLGVHLWSKQIDIAKALIEHKKVAVKSCHGSGKSWTASIVIAWWVDTRIDLDAIVVSTAPTYEQVNKILWEYLRALMGKHDLPGKITMEDEWKDENRVVAFGRKPSDTNQHGFQGIHRRQGVLAVLDEAGGIAESLWTGVEAITTGDSDRILAIANPDDPNTELGRIFATPNNGWHKITISAFDTPNFTGEWMPEEAKGALISKEWVEDKKISWGEDSPRYQSKVLGEFPTSSGNSLFSLGDINTGCSTELAISQDSRPDLGVDVARMGEDYTVVYSHQDGVLRFVDKWSKTDAVETANRIVQHAFNLGARQVRIDGVGLGGPVMDIVGHKSDGRFDTIGIVGNASSPDLDKWLNLRAWAYDTMRERMHNGQLDIDFEDKDLHNELLSMEYHFKNARSSLQIESKEELRKRLGKSPDYADAALYASMDLPLDPENPLHRVPMGQAFEVGLEEFLMEDEMRIGPTW